MLRLIGRLKRELGHDASFREFLALALDGAVLFSIEMRRQKQDDKVPGLQQELKHRNRRSFRREKRIIPAQ